MFQKLELTWYGKDKPIKPEQRILIKDDKNSNLGKDGAAENMISQFEYNSCALALHEGFIYKPDDSLFWKQSVSSEKSFLFVTTRHVTAAYLPSIQNTMQEEEYLTIACTSFDSAAAKAYTNITVKKIPQMLLEKCEFGKTGYSLNIVHPPVYEEDDE